MGVKRALRIERKRMISTTPEMYGNAKIDSNISEQQMVK
jgi:hypothetical protein